MLRNLPILLSLMVLLAASLFSHVPARAANADSTAQAVAPVNLNDATSEQLDELPGIGPALAERIVVYRDEHGPFTRIEQLNEVKGIGERTIQKLLPYLTLE